MEKPRSPWRSSSLDRESMEPLSTEVPSSGGVQDSVVDMPLYKAHSPKLHRPTPVPRDRVSSGRVSGSSMQSIHDDEPAQAPVSNGMHDPHTSAAISEYQDDTALLDSRSEAPHLENGHHQMNPPRHVRFHSRELNGGDVPSTDLSRPSGGEMSLASPDHLGNRESASIATIGHIHSQESDLEAVVRFLRTTKGLSYQVIGDLIGEHCERCCELLDLFTDSFDFSGLPFETALRGFLEAFRLPGEAQKINRILTAFASQYWRQCGRNSPFRNADAVFVLSYSVVMLNTDIHNPRVKAKMTMVEYLRNCRQINDGQDFNPTMLEELFMNIQQQSLRVPPDFSMPPQKGELAPRLRRLGRKSNKQSSRCCWCF